MSGIGILSGIKAALTWHPYISWLLALLIIGTPWLFFQGYYIERRTNAALTKRDWWNEQRSGLIQLNNVYGLLIGAGVLLLITPFGYGAVSGHASFLDCWAYVAPCLGGIVVGLGLLDTGTSNQKLAIAREAGLDSDPVATPPDPAAAEWLAVQNELRQASQTSHASASKDAKAAFIPKIKKATPLFPTLDLKFYVYSVGVIFFDILVTLALISVPQLLAG